MGRHSVLTSTAALALLLLGTATARAAEVSEVRVGTHDKKHTRIVVELDAAAGYRLSAPQPGEAPELVLTLDASSEARQIPSKSPLVRKVQVEPSGAGSIVRVQLATADVAVKEMLLSNPPRLVFDLAARGPIPKPGAEELAAKADATSVPAPKETAAAEPVVVPPPAAPVAAAEETKPVAPPVVAKTEVAPPPAPVAKPMPSEPKGMEPTPLDIPPPPAPAAAPIAKPAPPAAKPSVARTTPAPAPAPAKADGGGIFDLLSNPMVLAGVAAVVLLGFFLAMRRRRGDEDEDPLYTVMSADDASATASDVVGDRQPVLSVSPAWDADAFEASEPALRDGPRQLALGQVPVAQVEAASEPEPVAEPESFSAPDESDAASIFASEPQPEPASAFVAAGESIAVPVTAAAPVAAAPVSAEMERRLADLERRLEQLTEARERLERQVAAQTEELRVQRAAIARTQRVVRSIAKTEDVATEPVPRAPTA
jgi:hypothetical protein